MAKRWSAFLVRYDQRRAKMMAARRRQLAKQGEQENKRKPQKTSDTDDGLLRGFTEMEISESRKDIIPLMKLVKRLRREFDSSDSDLSESGCDLCEAYAEDYCRIHGPLLVIPNRAVTEIPPRSTRAEMSCPKELKIAPSNIPGAGLGVFTRIHMPKNVRFGPYEGIITSQPKPGGYAWQVQGTLKTRTHLLDAADPNKSNWLRYVNCARRYAHQNMTTFQYHGKLYYRTIENIPPNTELLIFYGIEYAELLGIDMQSYGEAEASDTEGDQPLTAHSAENKKLHVRDSKTSVTTGSAVAGPSHAGERPYQCTTCDARFTQSSINYSHESSHGRKAVPVHHV